MFLAADLAVALSAGFIEENQRLRFHLFVFVLVFELEIHACARWVFPVEFASVFDAFAALLLLFKEFDCPGKGRRG